VPARPGEIAGRLTKSGQVTLNSAGIGVLTFDPDNAHQRWEIEQVVVKTNQAATAANVPFVQLAVNTTDPTTMSDGNMRGRSWNGNSETFTGTEHIGPADYFSVMFMPAAGASGAPLAGVIASAVITGTKYTRRS
jgi:hypothetical protein